jgi:hypothetical protein
MTGQATAWAMAADVAPVAKLVLWVLASRADGNGQGTWATPEMMAEVVTQTTPATMRKHVGALLAGGYLREGDQRLLPGEWTTLPASFRPVVYDLAPDEATRLEWQAAYDPSAGRRGAAAVAGRRAGLASAARRGAPASCQENQHAPEAAGPAPAVLHFPADPSPEAPCQENEHAAAVKTDTAPVSENAARRVAFSSLGGVGGGIYLTQEKTNPPTPQPVSKKTTRAAGPGRRRRGTTPPPAAEVPPLFPAFGVTAPRDDPAEVDLLAAELYEACGRRWPIAEIRRPLASPELTDRTWEQVRRAALACLTLPDTQSPNRLLVRHGDWWAPPPKPTPAPPGITRRAGVPDDYEFATAGTAAEAARQLAREAVEAKRGTIRVGSEVRRLASTG